VARRPGPRLRIVQIRQVPFEAYLLFLASLSLPKEAWKLMVAMRSRTESELAGSCQNLAPGVRRRLFSICKGSLLLKQLAEGRVGTEGFTCRPYRTSKQQQQKKNKKTKQNNNNNNTARVHYPNLNKSTESNSTCELILKYRTPLSIYR